MDENYKQVNSNYITVRYNGFQVIYKNYTEVWGQLAFIFKLGCIENNTYNFTNLFIVHYAFILLKRSGGRNTMQEYISQEYHRLIQHTGSAK